jgi:hypothetical protein
MAELFISLLGFLAELFLEFLADLILKPVLTPVVFLLATPFLLGYAAFRRLRFETYGMAVGGAYRTLWERWREGIFV